MPFYHALLPHPSPAVTAKRGCSFGSRRSEVWPHLTSSCRTSLSSNSPARHFQDSSSGVEMSTRQSAALPCRFVHSGHFSRGKASIALCNDWNPSLAQSSDFHWPAELRGVQPRNLEQSTSLATSPRTVAEHLQAPAEDSAFPARVNHRPAPLWLNGEFGAAYKYPDSTHLNMLRTTSACINMSVHFYQYWRCEKNSHMTMVKDNNRRYNNNLFH